MMVAPPPSGKSQPHHSGVRLGKCQAKRKVISAELPAAIVLCWQTAPTALRVAGSSSSAPSCEKASQNNMGEFHQRPPGQPRQYVVWAPWLGITPSAKLHCIGSLAPRLGLVIISPSNWVAVRCSLTRGSSFGRATSTFAEALTGLSMENEIATFALAAVGLLTRYRMIATGNPEASGSCGMNGENASSSIQNGMLGSLNRRCASGYAAVNSAVAMRLNPGELAEPRPSCPSKGGNIRASSTRVMGLASPAFIHIEGNAYCGEKPLFGRLKISQSRSSPRPPRATLPAATPPSGKASILSCSAANTRGNEIFSAAPRVVRFVLSASASASANAGQ